MEQPGLFDKQDRLTLFASNLKRFGDLSESQKIKRIKSFGHQLWEIFTEQAEKVLLSSSIAVEGVDFWVEGEKFRLEFSHTMHHVSKFHELTKEERRNVFMVSPMLMSTGW